MGLILVYWKFVGSLQGIENNGMVVAYSQSDFEEKHPKA